MEGSPGVAEKEAGNGDDKVTTAREKSSGIKHFRT